MGTPIAKQAETAFKSAERKRKEVAEREYRIRRGETPEPQQSRPETELATRRREVIEKRRK